jgi:hypothetical protein
LTGDKEWGVDMKLRFMRAYYAIAVFAMMILVHGAGAKLRIR